MIPEHAKKVFSGILFEIYQWEQKLFDGSTTTFEKASRVGNASVIPIVGDKILMCEETQSGIEGTFITVPGGRLESGEKHLAAAQRELLEETGLESDDWEPYLETEGQWHVEVPRKIFIARDCKFAGTPNTDAGEKITCREYSFEDWLALAKESNFYDKLLDIHMLEAHYNKDSRDTLKEKFWPKK